MPLSLKTTIPVMGFALLLPCSGSAQVKSAASALHPLGSVWITPYLGVGFQGKYYDGIVRFSNGATDRLTIDPGSAIVYGVALGYRFERAMSLNFNLATSSPDAQYVEGTTLRPNVGLRTTQLEAGLLYDLSQFPVANKIAPFAVGGGLTLTFHSVNRFTWGGTFIEPHTTSVGVHGLAMLDIPLAPNVSLRGQGKLTVSRLARRDLENKLAFAEGVPSATVDGGTQSYFVLSAGVTLRL